MLNHKKVSRETLRQLQNYVDLILKWNGAINLISKSTIDVIWERHIDDSLILTNFINDNARVLDIGSGGGLPAIILAICGNYDITMVESDRRKSLFLKQCIQQLELEKISIQHARVEDLDNNMPFDYITSRACADLQTLIAYALPHMSDDTACVFIKGQNIYNEIILVEKFDFDYTLHKSDLDDNNSIVIKLWNIRAK